MSKIVKTLTNGSGTQKIAFTNRGARVIIDLDELTWLYDNGLEEGKNRRGSFELTPGTREVCEIGEVETMPKIVAKVFQKFGYDISSVWFDEGEEEEDDDE